MNIQNQKGFSLVELCVVCVIVGIVMTMTFPYFIKARGAAQNGNAYASMRTLISAQYNFYSQNARYARLDELNGAQMGGLGTVSGTDLLRGSFTYQMIPPTPTDAQLKNQFEIIATKATTGDNLPYVIRVTERGEIVETMTP